MEKEEGGLALPIFFLFWKEEATEVYVAKNRGDEFFFKADPNIFRLFCPQKWIGVNFLASPILWNQQHIFGL